MKRFKALIGALILISLLFVGCGGVNLPDDNTKSDQINEINQENLTIKDYYPFKENMKLEYEGIGNEFAEQRVFFEFIKDNRAQIKVYNPGTAMVKVLEYGDGELKEVFSQGEFYHIENMLSIDNGNNNIILKEPIEVGTSWETLGGYKRSITGIDVVVDTPYGDFEALEVTTEFGEDRRQSDYYAKGIGLIASIYKDGEFEVKTLLEELEFEANEIEIGFYYPMYDDIKIGYVEKDIDFNTNDSIEKILESHLKNTDRDDLVPPISENVRINSLALDRGGNMVRVDFSKELISEMNVGSTMENLILNSIVNTLADYYNVDKVYISTEGAPYASGHISIEKDEYFTVDYSQVENLTE